jgi:hypothetical protein
MNDFWEQERYLSLFGDSISGGAGKTRGSARSLLNKKIKQGGHSGKDVQNWMMEEAAMLIDCRSAC